MISGGRVRRTLIPVMQKQKVENRIRNDFLEELIKTPTYTLWCISAFQCNNWALGDRQPWCKMDSHTWM